MTDPASKTTILCRKCGAEGTHRCSMPGCPLPPLKDTEAQSNTTEHPPTEARLRFMCEQLREWGGIPEDDIRRVYEAESKRLVSDTTAMARMLNR